MNYPNFLCIGAHKAGTTWLYKALEKRPDVFMPVKEIPFFDREVSYPSPNFLSESNPLCRLLKKENQTQNIQITRALLKSAAIAPFGIRKQKIYWKKGYRTKDAE